MEDEIELLDIHEQALEELGRGAYELAGKDSRTMFVMLLCMAEMVYQQALYNAGSPGERKGTERLAVELRREAGRLSKVMFEELKTRLNRNN